MNAVAVIPGQATSIYLAELSKPSVPDVPNGRGILVLASVTDGNRQHPIPADKINLTSCSGTSSWSPR